MKLEKLTKSGNLDLVSPNCLNVPNTLKQVKRDPYIVILIRLYLMRNDGLKTLNHFLYFQNHDLGY